MRLEYNTSWNDIKINNNIKFIQDPILNIIITKEYFEDLYKNILNKIDGNPNELLKCIEYYFYINLKKKNTLLFISKEKKNEFYQLGMLKKYNTSYKLINEILKNKD
jgi:hypothetical protein